MNSLTIYKASAGSGKTFTLAAEYITMLISNPVAFRHILAVTFTHKATGEMKERIIQQLYGIWMGDPASDAYLQHIRGCLRRTERQADLLLADDDDDVLRQRAGRAMLLMLHDYGRFQVKTIDSFFQSVMQGIVRELGLTPNLNIELDSDQIVNRSVDSMLERLGERSTALTSLADYVDNQMEEGRTWQIVEAVKKFSLNLTREEYMQRGDELRQQLDDKDLLRRYRKTLTEMAEKAEEEMREFGRRFFSILATYGFAIDDLKRKRGGIAAYFRKLMNGQLNYNNWNKTAEECLLSATVWATIDSPKRATIIALAEAMLIPLLREAEEARQRAVCTVVSCRLSVERINQLSLLNHVDHEMRRVNHHLNRFLLTDTNDLLRRLVDKDDASFVFEKAGTEISHVMIDEFQDTSHMQWNNFRTLLLEGLSQNLGSMLVGDVKQAIYRWRNGDWEILERLTRRGADVPFPTEVRTLGTNYRSRPNVVDFNNRLFSLATKHLSELLGESEAAEQLRNAYGDVVQRPAKQGNGGYVRCKMIATDEKNNYETLMLDDVGQEIERLIDTGVRPDDIAILVRYNSEMKPLARLITEQLDLPVTSDEAFEFGSSPAVCLLVAAMRCMLHPDDKLSTVQLAQNIVALGHRSPDNMDQLYAHPETLIPTAFTEDIDRLSLLPLYDLVEELAALFRLSEAEGQDAYLFAFFDAVVDFMRSDASDIGRFLTYWDETLHKKAIPAGRSEGIRMLTIHKAKGLEYHTVLVPYCTWKLEDVRRGQFFWAEPTEPPYNAISLLPITYKKDAELSIYREAYLHERLQLWVDSLNLLYVAATRAEVNLLTWGEDKGIGGSGGAPSTVADLMHIVLPTLSADNGEWDEENQLFTYGEAAGSAPKTSRGTSLNKLAAKAGELPLRLRTEAPVAHFMQSNQAARFIDGDDTDDNSSRLISRGNLLHELFARIGTLNDIETAIGQMEAQGLVGTADELNDMRRTAERAFRHPMARDWYSGKWQLYRECTIIGREGGRTYTRRPDRVMTRGDETVVVDFKFAIPRAAHYEQVREYMQLLIAMGRPADSLHGYLWYVGRNKMEEVTLT